MKDLFQGALLDLISRVGGYKIEKRFVEVVEVSGPNGELIMRIVGGESVLSPPTTKGRPDVAAVSPSLNDTLADAESFAASGSKTIRDFPLFSPIEEAILQVATHEWQSASALAADCDMKANQKFYTALGGLAKRRILDSHHQHGWRINLQINIEDLWN